MNKQPDSAPSQGSDLPPSRRRRSDAASLVDWREPERNAHVLDWRERAHGFGLVPLEESGAVEEVVIDPPSRLLEEEEPEAFDRQRFDREGYEAVDVREEAVEAEEEDIQELPAARVAQEDVDLVRVYLNHIGKRKLL